MAQHDYVIDNGPGLTVRTDINAAFAAVKSSNSGPVAPASVTAGQLWFDTSTAGQEKLRLRNAGNTAWTTLTAEMGGNVAIDTVNNVLQFVGTSANAGQGLVIVRDNRATTTTTGNAVFSLKRQNSGTDCLILGNDGNSAALIGGNNNPMRFGNWVSGVFTESLNVSGAGLWTFTGAGGVNAIIGGQWGLELQGAAANIKFTDTTAGQYDFWLHADGNVFYVLVDRDGNGSWDTPHPMNLNVASGDAQIFGQTVYTTGNLPAYPVVPPNSTASTPNTLAMRDGSGDISVRLIRSEYDGTNPSIGFIMTQIDTDANNYVRPSTPAQLAGVLTGLVGMPVYTGSDANGTAFNIGHTVLAYTATTTNRNSVYTVYVSTAGASLAYDLRVLGGAYVPLVGSYANRGVIGNTALMQRIA